MANSIWKMTYKYGCGLNSTHTSGYHNKWEANPSGFKLPATHPWWGKVGQQHTSGMHVSFSSDTSASTIGSQSTQNADALVLSRSKTKTALEEASRKTESVEVAAALEAFAKVLNLK